MPSSARARFARLCANSPAKTSSSIENASWIVVSVAAEARPAASADRLPARNPASPRPAGRRTTGTPARARTAAPCRATPPPRTGRGRAQPEHNLARELGRHQRGNPAQGRRATGMLASPPRIASARTIRAAVRGRGGSRLAPIDERIAISPARVAPRTSMRLATLKQTIKQHDAAPPSSITKGGPVWVRTMLCPLRRALPRSAARGTSS